MTSELPDRDFRDENIGIASFRRENTDQTQSSESLVAVDWLTDQIQGGEIAFGSSVQCASSSIPGMPALAE